MGLICNQGRNDGVAKPPNGEVMGAGGQRAWNSSKLPLLAPGMSPEEAGGDKGPGAHEQRHGDS